MHSINQNTIEIQAGKVYAFNHERRKRLHIGTIAGATYEKGNAAVLEKPERSFSLMQIEYDAVTAAGAEYLRLIPRDKKATYTISLARFRQFAKPYTNAWYGDQWRVPVVKFEYTSKVSKRNARLDNPVREVVRDIIKERQLNLFG